MTEPAGPGPVVDTDALSRLERDVGSDVVLQLIEMFLDSGPGRVDAVHGHTQSGDTDAAAEVLHSFKSSAATLAATRLSDLVEQAELLARSGGAAELAALLEPIESVFAQTIDCLREYRERLR